MINFVKKIAQEAGEAVLSYSSEVVKEKKGAGNFVTEADLTCEKLLMRRIKDTFPTHAILSEETTSTVGDPKREDNLWVLDPLDGTANFRFGTPIFSVSVAYLEKGVVMAAAIYDPTRKELFWASKGKGAFLNRERISVREDKDLKHALIYVGVPYSRENFQISNQIMDKIHEKGGRIDTLGSAVLELAYVAAGRASLFFESGLKVWDLGAASLLIREAGGEISDFGKKFDLFDFKGAIAGNSILIKEFLRVIRR